MYPFASLPENLAAFCRTLRVEHGFRIGPGELREAARAIEIVGLSDERTVRDALRPILSGTRAAARAFDLAFSDFFFPGPVAEGPLARSAAPGSEGSEEERGDAGDRRGARIGEDDDHGDAADAGASAVPVETGDEETSGEDAAIRASYSPLEAAGGPDAPALAAAAPAWRDAARALVRRLHLGLSRRWRPAPRGRRFDLRRTLRTSLQTGGEAMTPRWLRRPRRAPTLVLVVDGSRSMRPYADAAMRIAVALASVTLRVEVFTFSTALQRVTRDVRRAAAGAPRRLLLLPHAWGGGTTIGACLQDLLRTSGERLLGRDTVVMIVSDGLDVGRPDVVRAAMRELHRRTAGLVWLNPLVETPGYEPTASGMRAARPYVTTFASANDLAGFERLSRLVRVRA